MSAVSPSDVGASYVRNGWWPNRTILHYFDKAVAKHPNKTAIVAPDARMTYGELAEAVECVAAGLAASGVEKGDVVSIQLPNCAEFVVLHLAATALGAVTNPLLPNYRAKELGYILDFAKTKVAVIPSNYRGHYYPGMYSQLWDNLPGLSDIVVVNGFEEKGMKSYETLLNCRGAKRASVSPDAIASLTFTSGTESTPKGVMHSHNTMMYGTLQMPGLIGLSDTDVVWIPSPVGHGTGFQWGVRQAITLGSTMVLQDIWDANEALRLIEEERCSYVMSATPFVQMLLAAHAKSKRDVSSLRVFACAGAPIPAQTGALARSQLGCTLIGMWGMTECFVASASAAGEPDQKLWSTDGRAMPGAELAIFDDARTKTLGAGEVGELATRGPHVALGYFNDPVRTSDSFASEGWLFSNDLATMDAEGYIRIVGRKKDIINRGGLKISAREIEDALIDHPSVEQVALLSLPDDRLGEKGCACVVARSGTVVSLADIVEYLSQRGMARYKLPEYLAIVEEIPMTASGKVQKFRLRDDILAGNIKIASAQP